jgi:hypothetical protein
VVGDGAHLQREEGAGGGAPAKALSFHSTIAPATPWGSYGTRASAPYLQVWGAGDADQHVHRRYVQLAALRTGGATIQPQHTEAVGTSGAVANAQTNPGRPSLQGAAHPELQRVSWMRDMPAPHQWLDK